MATKKPLLPPGSRWNTLERSSTRTKENEQAKNNAGNEVSNEGAPKLLTSVSTDQLTSLCESNYYRKPPRSISDDILSHDKGLPRKPLPPTPPLHSKGDRTKVDSTNSVIAQSSPTNVEKPAPPYRARNNPHVRSPNKSPKPPVTPRKTHSDANIEASTDKRPKPPIPRKPRTVYASNQTDRPPLPRRPDFSGSKPLEPPRPFQQTDVRRLSPSRDNQSRIKIPVNEANKSKPLERMLLSKSVDTGMGVTMKDIPSPVSNDRPASMILTSQVSYTTTNMYFTIIVQLSVIASVCKCLY